MIREQWLETNQHIKFSVKAPRVEDINIVDIAHSLAMTARFGGFGNAFYSVAQHSLYVAKFVPKHLQLEGLLHDAAEAYLCDMPRPIKATMPNFCILEDHIHLVLAETFGLHDQIPPKVKEVDHRMLVTEARDLGFETWKDWALTAEYPPYPWHINPIANWHTVKIRFLELFYWLKNL